MKTKNFFLILIILSLFSGYLIAAQRARPGSTASAAPGPSWGEVGLEINNTPGNTTQQNPKMINAEAGYYFVVWEDGRNGYVNLFAQKIDEKGALLWGQNGVAVAEGSGNQNFAQIILDNSGNLIVVWQDYRSGNADIYAQKISGQGGQLWGKGGLAVCSASAGQFAPEITTDGAGGAIASWYDYRSGTGEDIYAQRIGQNGSALWTEDGVAVSVAAGTQWYPKIASDGAGGALIMWTDGRVSAIDNNIYGQRVSSTGVAL